MTYATRDDLVQRYSEEEVAQRESVLGDGSVERILQDADAAINGYLAERYALPLTAVPDDLVAKAAALARYALLGDAATERARDDQKDVIAWLRDVQAGRVRLPVAQPVPEASPATVVMVASSPAVFGRWGRP